MLRLEAITVCYGKVPALREVSLEVRPGELVTLIGANGAGKTTTLKAISGLLPLASGSIVFEGAPIGNAKPRDVLARGIAHCPEGRRVFPELTVRENLAMGAYLRRDQAGVAADLERVFAKLPRLKERIGQIAGTLSGGEQQMLAIARALMSRPRLLLLDEPSLGLAPLVVKQIFEVIAELNKTEGLTVFLVEQNAFHALKLAHRGYVMVNGAITMQGGGAEMLARPEVRAASLEGGH